jgi:pimeloyl-ACP methyl ester carboxylesterase
MSRARQMRNRGTRMRAVRRRRRRYLIITSMLSVALTVLLVAWFLPGEPDDFYAAPDDATTAPAGTLLRSEPFTVGVPDGVEGWRILYRSSDTDGVPNVVSGLVLRPEASTDGPRPMVTLGHGTTGVDESCAPSLSARPLGSLPGVEAALAAGYTVAATDYPGLGTPGPHPYMIGPTTAHAVLDAALAASELLDEAPPSVTIWGFSQGGHAALFAGELAPTYAPELPLTAIVAFAPATDLRANIESTQDTTLGTLLVVATAVAWSEDRAELDLTDVVREESIGAARSLAAQCLSSPELPIAAMRSIQLRDDVADFDSPRTRAWARVLEENTPRGRIDVPVLVMQGSADPIMDADVTAGHVAERCAAGDVIELRLRPATEHFTLVARSVDDAVAWTADRLAGEPAVTIC